MTAALLPAGRSGPVLEDLVCGIAAPGRRHATDHDRGSSNSLEEGRDVLIRKWAASDDRPIDRLRATRGGRAASARFRMCVGVVGAGCDE